MRTGTAVLLLVLIVAFALFGWRALGWIALAIAAGLVIVFIAIFVAIWIIRRRMTRAVKDLRHVFMQHEMHHRQGESRPEAIDVEAEEVRRD